MQLLNLAYIARSSWRCPDSIVARVDRVLLVRGSGRVAQPLSQRPDNPTLDIGSLSVGVWAMVGVGPLALETLRLLALPPRPRRRASAQARNFCDRRNALIRMHAVYNSAPEVPCAGLSGAAGSLGGKCSARPSGPATAVCRW